MTLTDSVPAPASSPTRSADSLLPVLRAIPPECYERSNRRAWWLVARAVAIWIVVLGALAFTNAWYLVVPLWAVAGLSVAGLFILGHDGAHGALFESKRLNRSVGRALLAPSLHIYESWVFGHNRVHHGHTVRQGMDFVWHPTTAEEFRAMSPLVRLRHRVEWSAFGSGLYYMRSVWWEKMIRFTPPERHRDAVRKDTRFLAAVAAGGAALTVAGVLLTGGSVLGALWMIVKLFVVPFVLFSWVIGFAVYVHHIAPDIKWWPRRSWNSMHGQVEGTTVLRMPRVLNALFFYNIFLHVPHHVDMRIPCYELPRAADALIDAFPQVDHRRFRIKDFVAATRACKVYDFERLEWSHYPKADSTTA